jgi:hypothetical protein
MDSRPRTVVRPHAAQSPPPLQDFPKELRRSHLDEETYSSTKMLQSQPALVNTQRSDLCI